MKKIFQPTVLITLAAICCALVLGLFSVLFAGVFGDRLSLLLALPAVMIIGFIFFIDRYFLFTLILLLRPALDPILDKTKIGGFGVGGVLNALVIFIALLAFFNSEFKLRSFVLKIWSPFLFLLFVAVGYAPEFVPALKIYISLLSNAAIFVLAMYLVNNHKDYGYWLRIVLLSSLIPVLYGFVDYAAGGAVYGEAGTRVASTFSHPNILAFYLMLIISLSFYFIKSKESYISPAIKGLLPLYILAMIALLLFTKTRSAWAACFVFFVLYGLLYERKYLLLVIAAPFLALLIPEMRDRIVDLAQGNEVITYGTLNSYAWRKYIWESGLGWMRPSHYLQGYGVEAFMHYSLDFFPLAGGEQRGAHSVYVQLFFDIGTLGLLSFVWLYASLAFYLAKFYKQNKLMVFSAVVLIGQYAMIAYSDNMLSYLAFNWYFWFVLGATYSVAFNTKQAGIDIAHAKDVVTRNVV